MSTKPHLETIKALDTSAVLQLVNTKQRTKASRLLHFLAQSGLISWDTNGEVLIEGKPIIGSHIVDLVSHAVRPYAFRKLRIVGLHEFGNLLNALHVPKDLLGSPMLFINWTNE